MATALAAGTQVPIAAGAWCLALLGSRPDLHAAVGDPQWATAFVWEVLRLVPPTWVLPRVSTRRVRLGRSTVDRYTPVLVSPVALGQLAASAPGPEQGESELAKLDPGRWVSSTQRPGAWLPFGAGPHACPGKNLGIAQLTTTVAWASTVPLRPSGSVDVDSTRGLTPSPSTFHVRAAPDA
ncbi:cytochrome P450 [Nocardioides pantholopis]|uniref:cytochrome P450 n=1 Tax=Nocardioides pantholopis TaxID=2483798 RepID=UPI0037C6F81A